MNFTYETKHLVLRVEHQTAAPKVLAFYKRNRPYFDAWEITRPDNFYTEAYQSISLACEYEQLLQKQAIRFWLYEKSAFQNNPEQAPIIGSVSVSHIHRGAFQCGMFGYKLDHSCWGYGYAYEACSTIIPKLFKYFQMHRLEAYIMPANERSIKLIKRLGFQYEGIKKSYVEINHRYEDHLQYALIR